MTSQPEPPTLTAEQRTSLVSLAQQIKRDAASLLAKVEGIEAILGIGEHTPKQIALRCVTVNDPKWIQAIKDYRTETGAGLKEAKDAIDEAIATLGLRRNPGVSS